jgi:hypothetical protein
VLLLWFCLPVLLTSASSNPVHIHYLLLTCPAGHVLAAWGLEPLFRHSRLRWLAPAMLVAIALVFGLNLRRASQAVAQKPTAPQFDGWSLSASAAVGATIRELGQGLDPPLRICAEGHQAILTSLSGHLAITEQNLHFPDLTLLPGQKTVLYVLVNAPHELDLFGPLAEFFRDKDMRLADGTTVTFVRVSPYSREAALALPEVTLDLPSDSGLSLLGYSLSEATEGGSAWTCKTYWRVEQLLPGRGEWYIGAFYHLLDVEGQVLANISGQGRWAFEWEIGDVYVSRVSLSLPKDLEADPQRLIIGLFDPIHNVRYAVNSPIGSSDVVEIPLPAIGAAVESR